MLFVDIFYSLKQGIFFLEGIFMICCLLLSSRRRRRHHHHHHHHRRRRRAVVCVGRFRCCSEADLMR
jgi:hypothetical protein